jgi:ATP-dependent Clp protease protease subunit
MPKIDYRKIASRRSCLFSGEISFDSIQALQESMLSYIQSEQPKEWISLFINTEGGSIIDGFAFYDFVQFYRPKLLTISLGCLQSMGLIIFLSGQYRIIGKHTNIFLHPVATPKINGENIATLKKVVLCAEKSQKQYIDIILKNSNKNLTRHILENLINEEATISVEQAIGFGWAHEIIK